MSWNPILKIVDHRALVDNLFDYFEDNQADALLWANEGAGLADIKKFYKSAAGRLAIEFPVLMLTKKDFAETGNDAREALLQLTFEGIVTGSDTDTIVEDAARYAMAIVSMIFNVSGSELADGALNPMVVTLDPDIEIGFDELKGFTQNASMFVQIFTIRCTYKLIVSGY